MQQEHSECAGGQRIVLYKSDQQQLLRNGMRKQVKTSNAPSENSDIFLFSYSLFNSGQAVTAWQYCSWHFTWLPLIALTCEMYSFSRIHFAGTETATVWCGFMNGAIQSGYRAATEVSVSFWWLVLLMLLFCWWCNQVVIGQTFQILLLFVFCFETFLLARSFKFSIKMIHWVSHFYTSYSDLDLILLLRGYWKTKTVSCIFAVDFNQVKCLYVWN